MKVILATIIFILNALTLLAYNFEIDNKYYNIINENSVEITFNKDTLNSYLDKDIVIPASINYQGKEYKVIQIGEYTFVDCFNLNSVVIPESVTIIGNSAFQNCENLVKIEFPKSIEKIGKYAFALCKSISSISIPPKVKVIEEATFLDCENLEFVEFSENINSIGAIAFMMCKNLKSITLPKEIDNLEDCAIFNVCENLESIKFISDIPPKVNPMLKMDIDLKQCKLLVPIGSKANYENAETWKEFANIEEY